MNKCYSCEINPVVWCCDECGCGVCEDCSENQEGDVTCLICLNEKEQNKSKRKPKPVKSKKVSQDSKKKN